MKPRQKSAEVTRHRLHKGKYLVKRARTWYLETCTAGLQVRQTLETQDLEEAMRRAREGWTPTPMPPPAPVPQTAGVLTLGKAFEEYRAWYAKTRRSSERTLFALKPFVDSAGPSLDVKAISREHVQQWVDSRLDGRSPATVRSDFARCRAFLRWVSDRKNVPSLFGITRGIDQPKAKTKAKRAPSIEKVRQVLQKLTESHPWLGDYCRVLAETGMRPTELLGVRGADVRQVESRKVVCIVPWEERPDLKSEHSERVIPVTETAAGILERRREKMFDKSRAIFATEFGTPYKEKSVYHLFCEVLAGGRGKGIPPELKMTLYDFRHHFCSEHAAPGAKHMAIEALAAYIGHSPKSINTLMSFYVDADALRRDTPASVLGEPKDGEVVEMKQAKG